MKKIVIQREQQDILMTEIEEVQGYIEATKELIPYFESEVECLEPTFLNRFISNGFKDELDVIDYYENYGVERIKQCKSIIQKYLEIIELLNNMNSFTKQRIELMDDLKTSSIDPTVKP